MCLFAGILQALEDSGKTLRFSYKEEVAGSNPASPTWEKWCFAGKPLQPKRRPANLAGSYLLYYTGGASEKFGDDYDGSVTFG